MKKRILSAAAVAAALSCSSNPRDLSGSAHMTAIFSVPDSGVACIQLVASSALRTVVKNFSVTPGQNTQDLEMLGIPTGRVDFTGAAYQEQCGLVVSTSTPTWLADDVIAIVTAAVPASVQLHFHANGAAVVAGDFQGDQYTVGTVAGTAGTQGNVDGKPAQFEGPDGAALSADSTTLYIDDRTFGPNGENIGFTIRSIDLASGSVTTLAGSSAGAGTLDGPGTDARFARTRGVAISSHGLVILDRCAVRLMSFTAPYAVTTLVGTRNGDGTAWVCNGQLGQLLYDVAVREPDLYVVDAANFVVSKIANYFTAPVISVVAGEFGVSGTDDGALTGPGLGHLISPSSIVFPFAGNDDVFYVSDTTGGNSNGVDALSGLIRRVQFFTNSVTTVAGAPDAAGLSVDGIGVNARFTNARRLISDGSSLYIADGNSVRRYDLATNAAITIAGSNAIGYRDDVGDAALFFGNFGIARNPATGVIYVSEQGNLTVRSLTP